jgi:hypothetical protein
MYEVRVYHMLCSERDVRWCDDDICSVLPAIFGCYWAVWMKAGAANWEKVVNSVPFCITDSFLRYLFVFVFCAPSLGTQSWLGHHEWLMHDCYVYFSRNNPPVSRFSVPPTRMDCWRRQNWFTGYFTSKVTPLSNHSSFDGSVCLGPCNDCMDRDVTYILLGSESFYVFSWPLPTFIETLYWPGTSRDGSARRRLRVLQPVWPPSAFR